MPAGMLGGRSIASGSAARGMCITMGKPGSRTVPVPSVKPQPSTVPTSGRGAGGVWHTWGRAGGACQPCLCQAVLAWGSMAHRVPTAHNTHL